MIRLASTIFLVLCLCLPASAAEYTAPEVPNSGSSLMPAETHNFGGGLTELLK